MLYFTRWKAAAILLTAFVVCLFAVPNFLPEKMVQSWPKWAQRHVVLGLDLQGGSHILLEVDTNAVRKEKLESLRDDVRRVLRDARVGYTGLVVRGNGVEVRIREGSNFDQAVDKLRELSQPLGGILGSSTGQRTLDVTTEAGNLVRLTLTDPAIVDRVRQSVEQSIQIIERRVNELGTVEPLIQRQGTDRILVQVPGLQDPTRLKELLGKTAKLDFRMVDVSIPAEQALQGRVPPDSEILYSSTQPRTPYLVEKRILVSGGDLTDAQPGFDQRTSEPVVNFRFNTSGARECVAGTADNHRRTHGRPWARAGFDRQGQALILCRCRHGDYLYACHLRAIRPVCERCGGNQRRHDLRHPVAAQCDADAARHCRHRAHGGHRRRFQRSDLRAHTRGSARRTDTDQRDRRRVHPRACDHSGLKYHDLHRRCGAVLYRHRPGPRLRGDPRHRHYHNGLYGVHPDAADRCLLGALAAPATRTHLRTPRRASASHRPRRHQIRLHALPAHQFSNVGAAVDHCDFALFLSRTELRHRFQGRHFDGGAVESWRRRSCENARHARSAGSGRGATAAVRGAERRADQDCRAAGRGNRTAGSSPQGAWRPWRPG